MNRFSFTAQRAKREGGRKAANSIFHFPASPSSWPVPRPLLPRNVLFLLSFFLRSAHPSVRPPVAPSPVRVNEERERGSKSSLISAAGKCQTDERRESYQIFGRRVAREGEGEVGLHLLPSPFANTRQRASERDRVRSPLFSRPRIRIPSFRSLRPEAERRKRTICLANKKDAIGLAQIQIPGLSIRRCQPSRPQEWISIIVFDLKAIEWYVPLSQ